MKFNQSDRNTSNEALICVFYCQEIHATRTVLQTGLSGFRVLEGSRVLSLLQNLQIACGVHSPSNAVGIGDLFLGYKWVKVRRYTHLLSRLKMSGFTC